MAIVQMEEKRRDRDARIGSLGENIAARDADIFEYFDYIGRQNPNDYNSKKEEIGYLQDAWAKMEQADPHIFSLIETRMTGPCSLKYEIQGGAGKREAKFVEQVFRDLPNIYQILREIQTAKPIGYSATEVVWGRYAGGGLVPTDLKTRPPNRFNFDKDWKLRLYTKDDMILGELLPEFKFFVYTYRGRFGNRYGTPLLQSIYWYWYFKKHTLTNWAIFTERFAQPVPVANVPVNITPEDKDVVEEFVLDARSSSGVVLPEGVTIKLLEAQRTGSMSTYDSFMKFIDDSVSRAILGQVLSQEARETGTYAQAKIHENIRHDILLADVLDLEYLLSNTLIKWMVDIKFGKRAEYPRFKFIFDKKIDIKDLSEIVRTLHGMGYPISKRWVADTFSIPMATVENDIMPPPNQGFFKNQANQYVEELRAVT